MRLTRLRSLSQLVSDTLVTKALFDDEIVSMGRSAYHGAVFISWFTITCNETIAFIGRDSCNVNCTNVVPRR